MTYLSKDFIFNSDMEYPPILAEGKYVGTDYVTVTLKANMPAGADYHVFATTTSTTYGTGIQKKLAWVDAAGNLRTGTSPGSTVYWRVYAY